MASNGTWQRRSGIQLCYPFEEKRLQKWNVPGVMVQPKLDGERCRALIENGQGYLLSSEENPILSVPHIIEDLQGILSPNAKVELDGELYIHGMDFSQIHSRVGRTVEIHPEYHEVEYHVFDLINSESQMDRFSRLFGLLNDRQSPHIRLVRTEITSDMSGIEEYLEQFLDQGYEGIIVRNPYAQYARKRSTNIMKFKPRKEDIYEIIGTTEAIDKNGKPKNELGSLICRGPDGTPFGVGSGFSAHQRFSYWRFREELPGNFIRVKYQALTPKHVPRFPIFVEILRGDQDANS